MKITKFSKRKNESKYILKKGIFAKKPAKPIFLIKLIDKKLR